MKPHFIGHIDADCFYVSCERVRDQSLKAKSIAVLGNQGACVIARSYEMRPTGVKVGMPIWKAKMLCPEGIYIKRDFQWYEILSKKMQDILHGFSDIVEYYSVDESFIDIGNYPGNLTELATQIQQRILEEVGVPVSVGIGTSRTLAKIASEKRKPFGIQIVKPEELKSFLKACLVQEIPGVGRKLVKRISHLKTALDFINESKADIRRLLHKPGEELWYELQGTAIYTLRAEKPERKVISRGGSLWGNHQDPNYIWGFLIRNLERLTQQLVKEEVEMKEFTLVLVSSSGFSRKYSQNLADYTNAYSLLLEALKKCFQQIFEANQIYSYVHLFGGSLRSSKHKQLNLFSKNEEKQKKIALLKQKINTRYGLFTIRSGATAYIEDVFKDETSNYEICDIDGKICF